MNEPLFLDTEFEKTAKHRGVSLGEDPKTWPASILKEAFRQVPYLSDYDVDVVLDRQEDEKGTALGHLAIRNKEDTPVFAGMQGEPLSDLVNKETKIPVIVKEGQMRPLRVLADGNGFEPLTERRLGTNLFRADLAAITAKGPGSTSLVDDLYPPDTASSFGSTPKLASVLAQVVPTMTKSAQDAFLDEVRGDPRLVMQISRNESFADAVDKISKADVFTISEAAETVNQHMHPDVVQIEKGSGFYNIKTASVHAFEPTETRLSRAEVERLWGGETAKQVDTEGMITAGRTFEAQDDPEKLAEVSEYGRYRVKTSSGAWSEGWVFPQVVDLDMKLTDRMIYSDGLNATMEEKVAGIPTGGHAFPAGHGLTGRGFFMAASGDKAIATIPVTIDSSVRDAGGDRYYDARTDLGEHVKLSMVYGLKRIDKLAAGHYAIPEGMEFIRIRGGVSLVDSDPQSAIRKAAGRVDIISDGSCYTLDGAPMEKVAAQHREFVSKSDAEFVLVAAGAHPTRARAKLAEAALHGKASVHNLRELLSREESAARALEESGYLQKRAAVDADVPRVSLVKEASVVKDQETVDSLLSLGFLTTSNVQLFMDNIPAFEKAAGHLAELVVASQLGLKNVDEDAAHRAMTGVDAVISGLRTLEHNEAMR